MHPTPKDRNAYVQLCFTMAFDTVNYSILISKLYLYGIRGNSRLKLTLMTDFDSPFLNHMSLKNVNFTKFLGVIIDDQLKVTNHI